jgi:hypothetical protein
MELTATWSRLANYLGAEVVYFSSVEARLRNLKNSFTNVLYLDVNLSNDSFQHILHKLSLADPTVNHFNNELNWVVLMPAKTILNLVQLRDSLRRSSPFLSTGYYSNCQSTISSQREEKTCFHVLSSSAEAGVSHLLVKRSQPALNMSALDSFITDTVSRADIKAVDLVNIRGEASILETDLLSDVFFHVDKELYAIFSRFLYYLTTPLADSVENVLETVQAPILGTLIRVLQLSKNAPSSDPFTSSRDVSLNRIPRFLDASLCSYTGLACEIPELTSRSRCVRAGCCYDATMPLVCFSKLGLSVFTRHISPPALLAPKIFGDQKHISVLFDRDRLDNIGPLTASANILRYFEAGYVISVDGFLQATGEQLYETLEGKSRAKVLMWTV